MIPTEDIKVGAKIKDITDSLSYGGFGEYTIVGVKTLRILGRPITLVDLRPKPTLLSGWVNVEQVKRNFELVEED